MLRAMRLQNNYFLFLVRILLRLFVYLPMFPSISALRNEMHIMWNSFFPLAFQNQNQNIASRYKKNFFRWKFSVFKVNDVFYEKHGGWFVHFQVHTRPQPHSLHKEKMRDIHTLLSSLQGTTESQWVFFVYGDNKRKKTIRVHTKGYTKT